MLSESCGAVSLGHSWAGAATLGTAISTLSCGLHAHEAALKNFIYIKDKNVKILLNLNFVFEGTAKLQFFLIFSTFFLHFL